MTSRILHITGARPNFPKAAPVMRALDALQVTQSLVHTGQHYDDKLSDIFFRQLSLRKPDLSLGVGSGSHATQTAAVMVALETVFLEQQPSLVVVYGDVNSTLAAALVASKLGIPLAHVEAGLRSFDRGMPEELNRIMTDAVSDLLFTTSADANVHLGREGVAEEKIHFVGNPMIDTLLQSRDRFDASELLAELKLAPGDPYLVATLHRPANVDDPAELAQLVAALIECSAEAPIVLPMHPRGAQAFAATGILNEPRIHIVEPQGYLEFMGLVSGSLGVVTDSGGVQEETTMLGVPCFTLRPNTERPVTITDGTNTLVTAENVAATLRDRLTRNQTENRTPPLWDGRAGERIARILSEWLEKQ
ncbi:non-hydrolyzing UDP-N-acetylglucosamine 2-epimerase [Leucobacter luti]|uniref:non-hydrolyzing UDP-N-acetylglucosamine 2-epimerase n=1 Tax=Leucobacter luti TaxID=340320 RepID=UPI001052FBFC|nr:UDP-N-acetylglucosamine 2-epimerase (non-hydrolyzing) [Leucobacter luti]MCW2289847.1 UDP-N-acetylglucosamine 2-epimerase (non-hydrolyzing) [Leucobacter luti]